MCLHVPSLPHSKRACTHDHHMVPPPHASTYRCRIMPCTTGTCRILKHAPQHVYTCLLHGSSAHSSSTYASNTHGTSSVPATLDYSLHTCPPYAYTHHHASTYQCLTIPHMACTPEHCITHTHTALAPLPRCPHTSLLCLPHSITTYTHDQNMPTHIPMPRPIDASPCHAMPYTLHTSEPTPRTCLHHTHL
jgi:hypothetical protein